MAGRNKTGKAPESKGIEVGNVKQNKERVGKIVENMTLFDDVLMSRVFADNIDATELMLRIILGRDVKVSSVVGQYEMKNAHVGDRAIRLDIRATDVDGEELDVEVQGNVEGSHVRRARYHSSMLDAAMLKAKQPFKALKDSYVIFMYKADKFGRGLPIYHIQRMVKETGRSFGDGSHIIYVNGEYKGDDDIGKLVSDFHQVDPDDMYYDELAKGVKHYKTTEGENENMSETVEEYAREYAKECVDRYAVAKVKQLMKNMKLSLDQALNALGIEGESRDYVIKQLQNG